MAEGNKYYNESGDFDNAQDFDDLSRYRQEDQDYMRANSKTRINGETVDDGKNTAGFGKFGRKKDEEGNNKWGLLKKGEKDASEKPNANGKGGDKKASLGEKENNVKSDAKGEKNENGEEQSGGGGRFKNAVKGINELKKGKVGAASRRFRKAGPIIVILVSCLTFGGGSFLGQMAMPFSLISQFQEKFDSIRTSQNLRSKNFLRWQTAKGGSVKDCIKAHYFKADEFKVSAKQKSKLANSGITFETDADGVTVMRHVKANGEVQTIVADKSLAGEGRVYFEDAFDNDVEFRNNYTEGSRTWRGSIGAWFDSSMDKLLKKLGVHRGVWREFKSGKPQAEGMEDMKKTVASDSDSDSAKSRAGSSDWEGETEEVKGEDGKITEQPVLDEKGRQVQDVSPGSKEDVSFSRADVETDAKGKVKDTTKLSNKMNKVASTVAKVSGAAKVGQIVSSVYCGIQDFVGAVHGIVAAYQTMQIIGVASNIFEAIQKAQAGDGDSSPIHEISQALVQGAYNSYDFEDEEPVERERSAMEANAIGAIYGGTNVDMTDPSVKSFNINTVTKKMYSGIASVLNHVNVSASAFKSCTYAKLAAAAVGIAVDVVTVIGCAVSVGIGCLVDFLVEEGKGAAFSALFSLAVSVAISFLVPHVANILTRKIATEVAGEDLGNALVTGANIYMGRNHQYSGGGVASKESLTSFLQEQDRIIAEEARYERETRSPFDITSKYTFLGSLVNQMIPIASSATSLTSTVKGIGTVIGGAVKSLTPHSSAVSAGIEAQTLADNTAKYCPEMAEIGGIADFSCSPYIITDLTTMNTEPGEIVNRISNDDLGDDGNGNPVIKEGSKLAKYITYCGQRSSPWGFADQNIAGEVDTAGSVGGTVGQAIIGAIPIVGDAFDVASNKQKIANYGWISGESCVIGNTLDTSYNPITSTGYTDSVNWQEAKNYQRFIEDQRLAEAEGIIKESAVTQFLASYYEKHPIDTSYEGLLARYSGLTKENVEVTLAILELGDWIASYNPSDLAPYNNEKNPFEKDVDYQLEQNNYIAINTFANTTIKYGAYIDRRNTYSFTA